LPEIIFDKQNSINLLQIPIFFFLFRPEKRGLGNGQTLMRNKLHSNLSGLPQHLKKATLPILLPRTHTDRSWLISSKRLETIKTAIDNKNP
jgi:hypothetical protein